MAEPRRFEVLRTALIGASFANLLFMGLWSVFFQYRDPDSFFLNLAPGDPPAAMLNVLLAGAIGAAAGASIRRLPERVSAVITDLLAMGSGLLILDVLRQALRLTPDGAGRWLGRIPIGVLAVVALVGMAGAAGFVVVSRGRLSRWIGMAYLVLSPFLLVTFGRSSWIVLTGDLERRFGPTAPAEVPPQAGRSGPRVVVLVFDELDFRIGFSNRPPSVQMTEFDRLQRESLFASAAVSPASNTNEAMPSIITGVPIAQLVARDSRDATVQLAGSEGKTALSRLPTLFTRAKAAGFASGLVGWNLPYCRSGLGADLVSCDWWPAGILLGVAEPLPVRMLHQWASVLPRNGQIIHWLRVTGMLERGLQLAARPDLDLVLLHFAVPHYPWIWDASGNHYRLTSFGPRGYLQNLGLADRTLGEVRATLRSANLEERTVLVVTSDHPWREAKSLDGQSDPRVPFLVRLPGAGPAVMATPFNTIDTGDLCLALLSGKVETTEELQRWMEGRAIVSR